MVLQLLPAWQEFIYPLLQTAKKLHNKHNLDRTAAFPGLFTDLLTTSNTAYYTWGLKWLAGAWYEGFNMERFNLICVTELACEYSRLADGDVSRFSPAENL